MKSTEVIISGGGVPGLTLGILLAKAGIDVVLCDPSPAPDPEKIQLSGRTIALMAGSLGVLEKAGLLGKFDSFSEDLKILSVVDHDFRADFSSDEIGLARFGQNIQNNIMQAHALAAYRSIGGAKFIHGKLDGFSITQNHAVAEFSNGETYMAKILMAADGRNSIVRKKSGIAVWEHDYNQTAMTGVVSHSKPHRNNSIEFHFSGGPFTFVPMKNRMSSFVWMEKAEDAAALQKLPKPEIETIMQERSQDIFGKVTLETPIESYPVKIQKAKSLTAPRVALIAETAHVISPIGAQGLNLSLRDVHSLSEKIIDAARLGQDIGSPSVLKAYETDRLPDINLRVAGTDALNRSVATENPVIASIRRLGFKAAANIPPLRSALIRESLSPMHGLTQDMLSGFATRATVSTSTRAAPAA